MPFSRTLDSECPVTLTQYIAESHHPAALPTPHGYIYYYNHLPGELAVFSKLEVKQKKGHIKLGFHKEKKKTQYEPRGCFIFFVCCATKEIIAERQK